MRAARGHITRRGRESWELAVRIDGRRHRKTVHGTRKDAEAALLDYRRQLRDEGVPDLDPTLAAHTAEALRVIAGRVKPRTFVRYEQLLRLHVLPVIGNMRVRSLRAADVQRVLDGVLSTRSARTAHHTFRILSEVLAEAERWGIAPNVCKMVRPPRPDRPQLRIPTTEETRTLLDAVRGSITDGPAVLAASCGLRVGESLALKWKDVDLGHAKLRVVATMYGGGRTEPKTARSRRTVAIPAFAVTWLHEHRRQQTERRLASVAWSDSDYVFDRGGGLPRAVEAVSHRFGQLAETVGLADVRAHDLRHAYATRLLEANVNPKIVSEAMGHASVGITLDTYSRAGKLRPNCGHR